MRKTVLDLGSTSSGTTTTTSDVRKQILQNTLTD